MSKVSVTLEKGKMSEREVRDTQERAAARAREVIQQRGGGDVSQDKARREMEKLAQRDHREGKI